MNQHLQTILNLIQQATHLSADEKTALSKATNNADKDFEITTFKLDRTEKVKRTTAILLEETIEELEQKRKAVEAQNRELEIETALERVRTVAMSMRTPDDLFDICEILYAELQLLGFNELRNAMINIYEDNKDYFLNYDFAPGFGKTVTRMPYNFHPLIDKQIRETKNAGDAFNEFSFTGKELKDFRELRKNNGEQDDPKLDDTTSLHYYFYSIGTGSVGISTYNATTDEKKNVLKRFRNVFDLAYKRYIDITNAEEQAKEAQIQLALERVRARTMAMQNSNELPEASNLLFQQVQSLGMPAWSAGYCIWDEDKKGTTLWMSSEGVMQQPFHAPLTEDPSFIHIRESYERGEAFHVEEIGGEALVAHYKYMRTLPVVGKILDSIIAAGHPLPVFQIFHCVYFSQGFLLFITYEQVSEAHQIFKRFGKVFNQTYTRFLDLQKAEAQAREAKIEAALERVRSKTMAMHNSEDIGETVATLFDELVKLGVHTNRCGILINSEEKMQSEVWTAKSNPTGKASLIIGLLDLTMHPLLEGIYHAWKSKKSIFIYPMIGDDLKHYYQAINDTKYYPTLFDLDALPSKEFHTDFFFAQGSIFAFTTELLSEEVSTIFKRFAKVFNQAYTRFLDLQKAEAQAREAKIETGLERVRSRSMAMHNTSELQEVINTVHKELLNLNIAINGGSFIAINNDIETTLRCWGSGGTANTSEEVHLPLYEKPFCSNLINGIKNGPGFFTEEYTQEDKKDFFTFLFKHEPWSKLDAEQKKETLSSPGGYTRSCCVSRYTTIFIINHFGEKFSAADNDILKRFGKVFEQTYTRFLDLQKAEAQAREAHIEAALEKVRSRSLAMHKSDELQEVVNAVFERLKALDIDMNVASIFIFKEGCKDWEQWVASSDTDYSTYFHLPYTDNAIFNDLEDAKQKGKDFYSVTYSYQEKNDWFNYAFVHTEYKRIPDARKKFLLGSEFYHVAFALTKHTGLQLCKYSGNSFSEYDHGIMKRFAKVFEQAYVRFLDLQKAEAQARQAKIEAAMEKVRSRAMAMQKPTELIEVAELLRKEMGLLGVEELETSSIYIHHADTKKTECWYAIKDVEHPDKELVSDYMNIDLNDTVVGKQMLAFYDSDKKQISIPMQGDARKEWINYCTQQSKVLTGFYGGNIPDRTYHLYKFSNGYMGAASPGEISTESWDLLQRATSVFSLAYTRFSDLQQAEAQTREATIEMALERVRSRTLAMQKSDELAETAAVLFRQLILLGIEPNRLYIGIIKDDDGHIEFWVTDEDGSKVSTQFTGDTNRNASMKKMYDAWKAEQKSLTINMQGKELENYFHYLAEDLNVPFKKGLSQKRRIQSIAFFGKGFIGIASPDEQPEETTFLLERFAAVFNLTYTRFNDLKIAEAHAIQAEEDLIKLQTEKKRAEDALTELRATQTQLIQSEKMASLGELTAGIAHEIQNPLNFVNNFSEVSNELIDEMNAELDKGDIEEAKAIAHDIKQNLEKINHHGKRADGIVKGMLQHSRTSAGQMELTDINVLADEYLRLAYHGLRAKNKSFNATLQTDFDTTIEKVNIVPQDIGRVILNLINNAFYAVAEKKKLQPENYEPTVWISTKKTANTILIAVRDNGNGIPQKIADKIFQPFFTTKPTGQGTGLGLSLAYDIVKAHGGEIKVETKEGDGSQFIIQLPA